METTTSKVCDNSSQSKLGFKAAYLWLGIRKRAKGKVMYLAGTPFLIAITRPKKE
jgi:hypothetical protein